MLQKKLTTAMGVTALAAHDGNDDDGDEMARCNNTGGWVFQIDFHIAAEMQSAHLRGCRRPTALSGDPRPIYDGCGRPIVASGYH